MPAKKRTKLKREKVLVQSWIDKHTAGLFQDKAQKEGLSVASYLRMIINRDVMSTTPVAVVGAAVTTIARRVK